MTLHRLMRRAAVAVVLLTILHGSGCKGGDPLSTSVSPITAGFLAETVGAADRYVSFETAFVDEGRIGIDVIVADVPEETIGLVMKLSYPNTIARYEGCSILSSADYFPFGDCISVLPEPGLDPDGEVFVSRTVLGAGDTPIVVTGEQVILRLEFLLFGQGEGPIVIEGQNLGGSDASALLDVDQDPIFVEWFSGVLLGD